MKENDEKKKKNNKNENENKKEKNIKEINVFIIIKKLFNKKDCSIINFKKYINNIEKNILMF